MKFGLRLQLNFYLQVFYVNYELDRVKGNDIWFRYGFYIQVCYCYSILNFEI